MRSRIRLFGLPDRVNVVRRADEDDGAGGVTPDGPETVIYEDWECRVALYERSSETEQTFAGQENENRYTVTGVYAPNIRKNDFVLVPWGTMPNESAPTGLPDGFPYTVELSSPYGDLTLTWNSEDEQYASEYDAYIFWFDSDNEVWTFHADSENDTFTFDGFEFEDPIFGLDWGDYLDDASWEITNTTGPDQDFRVLWVRTQRDERGDTHHTTLVMELEDANPSTVD